MRLSRNLAILKVFSYPTTTTVKQLYMRCLHNHYQDCCTLDVGETIERDCLSVLHKLHDQVNGLQLVQVVVQPLARLFNPASLAALATNVTSSTSSSTSSSATVNNDSTNLPYTATNSSANTSGYSHFQQGSNSGNHHNQDLDVLSTSTTGASSTHLGSSGHNHSRTQSFASTINHGNASNNSLLPGTSTYMMSPDTAQALIARLDTDRDVNWLMEIIGYGLSMPFSLSGEQDSVKDCCTIYCEWLASALLPYNEHNEDSKYQQMSKLVPVPIRKDPNRYARKMISHLYNVFLPRQTLALSTVGASNQKDHSDAALTAVSRQAVLCHRVLRTIESIAQRQTNLMDNQTWDHLLALLLTVNDKLLSAPTEQDDIGTQLHDRILGVLFELMLLASAKSIPTPSLWKTFHEMSLNWRHRPALVDHWKRITLLLTKRIVLIPILTGRNRQESDATSSNSSSNQDSNSSIMLSSNPSPLEVAIASMNYENLSQTWYRFLNLIGNPVELSDPNVISRTDEFYHSACASDNVLDPRQHPCLSVLPQVFMNSMTGLRGFIETFLGTYQVQSNEEGLSTNDVARYSKNRSTHGSIASLANNNTVVVSLSSQSNQTSATQHSSQQQHSAQSQAVTPTQLRRTGIKSIAMKGGKVLPSFSSSSSGSHPPNALGATFESGQLTHETKSGSITNSSRLAQQQQFNQPKTSLTSLPGRTGHQQSQLPLQTQFKLYAERPKCNSILHIFGDWLFSAALIGSDLNQEIDDGTNDGSISESSTSACSTSTATEISGLREYSPYMNRKGPFQQQKSTTSSPMSRQHSQVSKQQDTGVLPSEKITLDPPLSADSFECGQAEAMAILCKIFASKTSTEDISPSYLSRFYLALQHCLTFGSGQDSKGQQSSASPPSNVIRRQLLASVLINSTTLLQKDLDGINLLIPSFIKAIEFVFECSDRDAPIQAPPRQHNKSIRSGTVVNNKLNDVTNYDVRKACILTLLNLLAYPFHFQDLVIRNCLNNASPTTTFKSLRPRLLKLLFIALQTETDATNMHILFCGLSLAIHDLASNAGKISSKLRDEGPKIRQKNDSSSAKSGNNDSANSSLDPSDKQEDTISQSSFVFDSNSGFLVKSLHVVCHLLINIWKHDTHVSLAALELLTTIARVSTSSSLIDNTDPYDELRTNSSRHIDNNNRVEMKNEYKQTTKWIIDYISNQCSRPPPAHSRDMHSTIVAAYQCLSVWFYNHPYLLNDIECVTNLMEVIELGVSGQKSRSSSVSGGQAKPTTILRGDKIMKPSSMRVREAAESLLNICMVRSRMQNDNPSSYDTVLDELNLAELFGGVHQRPGVLKQQQANDADQRQLEAYKLFKYFSDEDSVVFAFYEGSNQEPLTKDSAICLLRTPFGKHCWKMKFNYYTERSREKIIANKTQGLIKRPFQQCNTPTPESRLFPFTGAHNKSLYFNNTARFFPETIDNISPNELDRLVSTLDDYMQSHGKETRVKSDFDIMNKLFAHQVVAEQKVMSECSIRIKRADCEEPQPLNELEAARIIVTHLGLKTTLNSLPNGEKIQPSFVNELKSLDRLSVRTCDTVSIFYVRKNRTSPKEILESVRVRHNVCLAFFEWILELGQPIVVKSHCRWTGKVSNSWNSRPILNSSNESLECQTSSLRNQMLLSDHGGAIFDGDRMTLYWSDMCQELAFLIPHKIGKANLPNSVQLQSGDQLTRQTTTEFGDEFQANLSGSGQPASSPGGQHDTSACLMSSAEVIATNTIRGKNLQEGVCLSQVSQDHNSDGQSLCSVTSDTSSQSTRAPSQQSSPRNHSSSSARDQKDNVSLSRHSIATQKKKSNNSTNVGCDTNIIICWLECPDDMHDVPCDTLLWISENGYLMDDSQRDSNSVEGSFACDARKQRSRDFVKYFISPMKNGLYRVNLATSFGRQWLALPLVDGMTVSKGILSSLVRESVLNLCRRRRLDADSYQPPHVKRRLKIQDICSSYKISSRGT